MGLVSARRCHSCELVTAVGTDEHLPTIAESGHLDGLWVSTWTDSVQLIFDVVARNDDEQQTSSSVE
jgi:hypothetical protein